MKSIVITGCLTLGIISLGMGAALATPRGGNSEVMFERLDANGDGQLSADEIRNSPARRWSEADANGDGTLSLEELEADLALRVRDRAQGILDRLDRNDDGVIAADELPDGKRLANRLKRVDADGDGAISAEEFKTARARIGKRGKGPRSAH